MNRQNTHITLHEAEPGMVLADDLLDTRGMVLLPAGATLTPTIIASLQRREIDTMSIQGEEIPESDNSEELAEYEQRLASVFRKQSDDDMATEILRQFIYNFRFGTQ